MNLKDPRIGIVAALFIAITGFSKAEDSAEKTEKNRTRRTATEPTARGQRKAKPEGPNQALDGPILPLRVIACPDLLRGRTDAAFGSSLHLQTFTPDQLAVMSLPPGTGKLLVASAPGAALEETRPVGGLVGPARRAGAVVVLDPNDDTRVCRWNPPEQALLYKMGSPVQQSFDGMGFGLDISFSPDGKWCIIGCLRGGMAFLRDLETGNYHTLKHPLFQVHARAGSEWLPDNTDLPNGHVSGAFCSDNDFFVLGSGKMGYDSDLIFVGNTGVSNILHPQRKPNKAGDPNRFLDDVRLAAKTGYFGGLGGGGVSRHGGNMVFHYALENSAYSYGKVLKHCGNHAEEIEKTADPQKTAGSIPHDASPLPKETKGHFAEVSPFSFPSTIVKGDNCYRLVNRTLHGKQDVLVCAGDATASMLRLYDPLVQRQQDQFKGVQIGSFTCKSREMLWFTVRGLKNDNRADELVLMDVESGKATEITCQIPGKKLLWPDDSPIVIDGEAGLAYYGDSQNSADEKARKHGLTGQIFVYDISRKLESLLKEILPSSEAPE